MDLSRITGYLSNYKGSEVDEAVGQVEDLQNQVDEIDQDLAVIEADVTTIKDTLSTFGNIVTHSAEEFATAGEGALAQTALQPGDNISELDNDTGFITSISSEDVTTALGYIPYDSTNPDGFISGIDSEDVTIALGYTPYDSTNPDGFISSITSVDVTEALGYTPYDSTNPDGFISSAALTSLTDATILSPTNGQVLTYNGTSSLWENATIPATTWGSVVGTLSAQTDLQNALNNKLDTSLKGAVNGLAELDDAGKVPSSQLPAYVDDVIELLTMSDTAPAECAEGDKYYNTTSKKIFTATGTNTWGTVGEEPERSVIYVALDDNYTYRWSGSTMINLGNPVSAATESTAGIAEIATSGEVATGTDDDKIVTPLKLAGAFNTYDSASRTLTNKTINADNNSISELTTSNLKSGVIGTVVRATTSASGTVIPSEKAVAEAIKDFITGIDSNDVTTALGYTPYDSANPDGFITSISGTDVTDALGYTPYDSANPDGFISSISSSDVTSALGFTPYDSANPDGFLSTVTSTDVTTALGYTPYDSTNPDGFISSISSSDVTDALGYTPYDSTNPDGFLSTVTNTDVTTALGYTPYDSTNPDGFISSISGTDVTTALGYTPYDSANPDGYISSISSVDVTDALGFTPYNSANPDGFISSISGTDVTTALGYTPYNSTNPDGFISSASMSALTDVTISSVTDGEILRYDSTLSKWKNTTIPAGVTSLDSLTDVDITSPATGENLTYDAATGKWKNTASSATVAWGGISGTLSDQTDLQNALDAKTSKFTATCPALTSTDNTVYWTISNTLGTKRVQVCIYETATYNEVLASVTSADNEIVVKMISELDITAGDYEAIVIG